MRLNSNNSPFKRRSLPRIQWKPWIHWIHVGRGLRHLEGTLGTLGLLGQMANADAGGAASIWWNAQWKGSTRLGITLSVIQTPTWLLYLCVFSLQKKQVQGANYEVQEMFIIVDVVPLSAWQLNSLRFSRCSTILNRHCCPCGMTVQHCPTPAEALTAATTLWPVGYYGLIQAPVWIVWFGAQ